MAQSTVCTMQIYTNLTRETLIKAAILLMIPALMSLPPKCLRQSFTSSALLAVRSGRFTTSPGLDICYDTFR